MIIVLGPVLGPHPGPDSAVLEFGLEVDPAVAVLELHLHFPPGRGFYLDRPAGGGVDTIDRQAAAVGRHRHLAGLSGPEDLLAGGRCRRGRGGRGRIVGAARRVGDGGDQQDRYQARRDDCCTEHVPSSSQCLRRSFQTDGCGDPSPSLKGG